MTWTPSLSWLSRLQEIVNVDPVYLERAKWLTATVGFCFGESRFVLYFVKGKIAHVDTGTPLTGVSFSVKGPLNVWERLVRGEIDIGRALTPPNGKLSFEGDIIKGAGSMRALHHLCEKMKFTFPGGGV